MPLIASCAGKITKSVMLPILFILLVQVAQAQTTAFYVAPNGSDSNPGTLAAPFATLARAQLAMENSGTKTTYVRGGNYYPVPVSLGSGETAALHLTSIDSGETWSYYPSDGIGSAIIDGGSSSASTGIGWGFFVDAATNVTVDGLQLQHFANQLLQATNGASGTQFINNVLHDTYNPQNYAGVSLWGNAPNSVVANNYIYNTVNHGILASTCSGGCAGGISGDQIKNNFVYNTCTVSTDCGAIYSQDYASPRSTNISITNNFIRDVDTSGDNIGGRGIYLDDGTSNVTVSGNIVTGNKVACFNIHGGYSDVFSGNLCDEQSSGGESIALYQTSSASTLPMTGNEFIHNIIIAGSTGSGSGYNGDGAPNPATIDDNAYYNYVGATMNWDGSGGAGSDTNPSYEDPQLSTWCYAVSGGSPVDSAPVSFPVIQGNWGPPGFVVPSIGTPPSSPHSSGCSTSSPAAPPAASLTANPTLIAAGQSSTLNWSSTNATGCTGSGFSTGGAVSGSTSVAPTATATYSVTCTGSGGSISASATLTVSTSPPPAVPTVSLSASPTSISAGQSSTLSWSSTNATSCTGSGFTMNNATSGTATVTPSGTTTYSVDCTGAGGSAAASTTVTVTGHGKGKKAG